MEGTAVGSPWAELAKHAGPGPLARLSLVGPVQQHVGRALLATRLGDHAAAERLLSTALDCSPALRELHEARAAARLHLRDSQGALDDARACLALDPGWARAWARLGAAQLSLGHPRAALSAFERAARLDPGSTEAAAGLGLAAATLEAQGDRRSAQYDC